MHYISSCLWVVLVMLSVLGLYQVRYSVEAKESEIATLERRVNEHESAIQVLEAEWAYLVRPQRLRELASRYLDIEPVGSLQVVADHQADALHHRGIVPVSALAGEQGDESLPSYFAFEKNSAMAIPARFTVMR